jgi:hypothetical protein
MRIWNIVFIFACLFLPLTAFADVDVSSFQSMYDVTVPDIQKPTVVRVTLSDEEKYGVVIIEKESGVAQPWVAIQQKDMPVFSIIKTSAVSNSAKALVDNNLKTITSFDVDADDGQAFVELESNRPIRSSQVSLYLDEHVALPRTVSLKAFTNGKWRTVVASKKMVGKRLLFPPTTASKWRLTFQYAQPIRIRELVFKEETPREKRGEEIRWLARPEMQYALYVGGRTYVDIKTAESGRLIGEELEIQTASLGRIKANSVFREPDYDEDSIPDLFDNCTNIKNKDQEDIDDNGKGDACEDFDGDYVLNINDNCPDHPNANQRDEDDDGQGDVCDGVESRVTEKYPWLPWGVMGLALVTVVFIVIQTVVKERDE